MFETVVQVGGHKALCTIAQGSGDLHSVYGNECLELCISAPLLHLSRQQII